jgi:hypothetical protein
MVPTRADQVANLLFCRKQQWVEIRKIQVMKICPGTGLNEIPQQILKCALKYTIFIGLVVAIKVHGTNEKMKPCAKTFITL